MSGALLLGALSSLPGSGCVLPPDLEPEDPDGGPSSPPVIMAASPPDLFAFPGPIIIDREQLGQVMTLAVEDNDLADELNVRFYVDYNRLPTNLPTPALVDCNAPADSPTRQRNIDCTINALCNGVPEGEPENRLHVLEAMVADREFIPDSDPEAPAQMRPYRALANPEGAGWSIRAWNMRCQGSQ